ncbi:hypothetical protein SIN8267_02739 [Sinobacterium norvegicum]|uniref:Secreted protein n=1 Tax=Sinobacterium norvegicum TaxID=1641715 RepID=A0ABN8EQQ6_9GAMM|nr:VPLPA-CTERM sorting domain-containing protein [Sinobacterium norvegicum]CAH0992606.1 hypothetical protein SIN8267_02739 [Sinobacterium norvegicum]
MKYFVFQASSALLLSALSTASATADYVDFTGLGSINNTTSSYSQLSNGGVSVTADAGHYNIGSYSLDGFGVHKGGINLPGLQNGETLGFSFNQSVNITGIKFRQWEGPDKAILSGVFGSLTLDSDSCAFCSSQSFGLNIQGISSFDVSGASSLSVFLVEGISFDAVAAVPVPASAWLFGSSLLGLASLIRRKRRVLLS